MDSNSSLTETEYVFVYGTLKSDQPYSYFLHDKTNGIAKFVAEGRTVVPYPFITATKWNLPFLLQKPGHGKQIYGEIYKIDDKMMKSLDETEKCPSLYSREQIQVEILGKCMEGPGNEGCSVLTKQGMSENHYVTCWVYALKSFPDTILRAKELEFIDRYDALKHRLNTTAEEYESISEDFFKEGYIYQLLLKDCQNLSDEDS